MDQVDLQRYRAVEKGILHNPHRIVARGEVVTLPALRYPSQWLKPIDDNGNFIDKDVSIEEKPIVPYSQEQKVNTTKDRNPKVESKHYDKGMKGLKKFEDAQDAAQKVTGGEGTGNQDVL